jgi:NAD(P)-dependent dehydrogenase (short-subunit alcohol dehydrogenase family)
MGTMANDQDRRLCVVTGASSGIGRETARGIAERGVSVVVVGRNPEKTAEAEDYVRGHATGGAEVASLCCDFAHQAQVRNLAAEILGRWGRLDMLINNAGIWNKARKIGPDGIEEMLAVNHLAPYLLTRLLLKRLQQHGAARIVHVSSRAHRWPKDYEFDDMQFKKGFSKGGLARYSQNKLANVMFSNELARRLDPSCVTSNSLHPGDLPSDIVRDRPLLHWAGKLASFLFVTPAQAAETSIYLATAPDVATVSGKYFKKCAVATEHPASLDREACERLWNISAELVGLEA